MSLFRNYLQQELFYTAKSFRVKGKKKISLYTYRMISSKL